MESEVGSFFSTVCGRCTLLVAVFFDALLASFFNGFSGGIIEVVCGKSSVNTPPGPPGDFLATISVSTLPHGRLVGRRKQ